MASFLRPGQELPVQVSELGRAGTKSHLHRFPGKRIFIMFFLACHREVACKSTELTAKSVAEADGRPVFLRPSSQ